MTNHLQDFDNTLFTSLIDKFSHALGELEKFETHSLKRRLTECIKYMQDMGAAQEIEDFQNIKVTFLQQLNIFSFN